MTLKKMLFLSTVFAAGSLLSDQEHSSKENNNIYPDKNMALKALKVAAATDNLVGFEGFPQPEKLTISYEALPKIADFLEKQKANCAKRKCITKIESMQEDIEKCLANGKETDLTTLARILSMQADFKKGRLARRIENIKNLSEMNEFQKETTIFKDGSIFTTENAQYLEYVELLQFINKQENRFVDRLNDAAKKTTVEVCAQSEDIYEKYREQVAKANEEFNAKQNPTTEDKRDLQKKIVAIAADEAMELSIRKAQESKEPLNDDQKKWQKDQKNQ